MEDEGRERQWPKDYLEASGKHPSFDKDSAQGIWDALESWRKREHVLLDIAKRAESEGHAEILAKVQTALGSIADFKNRILEAIRVNDKPFRANLAKALDAPKRPESITNGIQAAADAFWELFVEKGLFSSEDWPTKHEVRRRAEEILKKNGYPPLTDRQWPRIYRAAGLSELDSVTRGSARKKKSSH